MNENMNARVVVCPECGRVPIARAELKGGLMVFSTCCYCGKKLSDAK